MCCEKKLNIEKCLSKLEIVLVTEGNKIYELVHNKQEYDSDFFDLKIECNINEKTNIESQRAGLYVFEYSSDQPRKFPNFDDVEYAPKLNKSNHDKLKIQLDDAFKKGDILYLGKHETNLGDRLNEHITTPSGKSTYSLRLSDGYRIDFYNRLKLYYFELKLSYSKYPKQILSKIESVLHDKLLPRCGRK